MFLYRKTISELLTFLQKTAFKSDLFAFVLELRGLILTTFLF